MYLLWQFKTLDRHCKYSEKKSKRVRTYFVKLFADNMQAEAEYRAAFFANQENPKPIELESEEDSKSSSENDD